MNFHAIAAIYQFEMARFFRTIWQSIVSPVLSTSLYFIVFGSAIGSRIQEVDGVSYGAFIVPGLIMLTVLQQSISNAAFGIYFPKFMGTIFELLSAPVDVLEIVIGYVGAAATKSLIIGTIILATSFFFVDINIVHPVWMLAFLVLTCFSFAMFGFIIGIWAKSFEQLNLIPMLIVTPLVFLGGSFYSITMLPPFWSRDSAGRSSDSPTCPWPPRWPRSGCSRRCASARSGGSSGPAGGSGPEAQKPRKWEIGGLPCGGPPRALHGTA